MPQGAISHKNLPHTMEQVSKALLNFRFWPKVSFSFHHIAQFDTGLVYNP
jgi:hypothetical protein